ncbi:class I SAM-dependent methyltransferase [Candidatus Pelagibacter sp.]|nr:class I SAM-dependent methyltransferase [Candidatus Pelagibacter sp.]|tara:strand:- start:1267 stop:2166 length:900 start_codon:yes stop_codon:yes gene_type:complete
MNFLKKKINKEDGIFKFEINDNETKKVTSFYKESPFPNYKSNDDKSTILDKGNKNYLTSKFKNFIGYKKDVLEVGCGTGQLAIYFALGTNNRVVGLDPTIESLKLAADFSKKQNIDNIDFINADIFDDVLADKYFDFIWCNGVLHHTKDPYKAFRVLIKSLKNEGYVLIGLYNKFGRIRTVFRRYMFKIFGSKYLDIFDPTLRNLKNNEEERKAWIRDQYIHPIESLHTIDNVLEWFNKNDIEFINSIPSSNFEDDDDNLFSKKSKGDLYSRVINQLSMIFNNLGSDGGLFIIIGKKNA